MNGMNEKRARGFTLIELMIVIAIVGLLAGVAYPSYQNSVRKSNRADAMDRLLDTAQRLERCFTVYGTYNNANCAIQNGNTLPSAKTYYNIAVTATASTYSLTATPVASKPQVKDTKCTSFTLDNTGKKTSTPTGSTCW